MENDHIKQRHKETDSFCTYRFLDFFFFVPSGPTSQLQGDPELSWGERKESTHCIIHSPHRKRALSPRADSWRQLAPIGDVNVVARKAGKFSLCSVGLVGLVRSVTHSGSRD